MRHGKYSTYSNHGCRCDACREAWNEYYTSYRRARGQKPLAQYHAETMRHGPTRYRKGCRCDVCRGASARQKAEQRARNPEYVARELAAKKAKRRAAA